MSWSDYKIEDTFSKKKSSKKKKTAIDMLAAKTKENKETKKNSKKEIKKSGEGKKQDKPKKSRKDEKGKNKDRKDKSYKFKNKKDHKGKQYSNKKSSNKQEKNIPGENAAFSKKSDSRTESRRQTILSLVADPVYVPMKGKEMAVLLNVPKDKRSSLYHILNSLVDEGKISVDAKGRYVKGGAKELEGLFTAHPRGFGFVTVENYEEDFYIPAEHTGTAIHHDTVRIRLLPKVDGRRREAKIIDVLEHEITQVVGTYEKVNSFGFVTPDDQKLSEDIFIPEGWNLDAKTGHKVVVTITKYASRGQNAEGRVIEDLGSVDAPGTDILSVVKAFGIPSEFPEDVLQNANEVFRPVDDSQISGRLDLRDVMMVTIDGDDSKDLDDAISLERDGDDYILGVHIADVSEYVREKSPLDKEALKRGTSVYLTDRVIPMLPKELSNGICSLNQGEDRLALSCIMTVNGKGRVIDHQIAETVVRINYRMTYHSVKLITEDQDPKEREKYAEISEKLDEMLELSKLVRAARHRDGCIDFDFPETKILLDENGVPTDIVPYEHSSANELIEDFMVLANETVAEEYAKAEIPFLYRSHEEPDGDKIHDLSLFAQNFGVSLHASGDELKPLDVQKFLRKIQGMPEEDLITRLTLRSMQQAKYTTDPIGHFGLAAKYYSHFTSPIRRYPDLQIHRIIKENLRGKLNQKRMEHYRGILPMVATQTSQLERREDEAEREVTKMKKAEFMKMHVGEVFDGIISGVTNWGLYVELPNTVEGLVHISSMRGDYYQFMEKTYQLIGERTGVVYSMGQPVTVRVEAADVETRTIDFVLEME